VVGVGAPFEQERIDQPTAEPDPQPDPGLRIVGAFGGHEIVELAVEMRNRQHRQHARDRLVLGRLPGLGHHDGLAEASDVARTRLQREVLLVDLAVHPDGAVHHL
jgi:hypothetical protein